MSNQPLLEFNLQADAVSAVDRFSTSPRAVSRRAAVTCARTRTRRNLGVNAGTLVVVNNVKRIQNRTIDTNLLDGSLAGQLTRQGVTEGDVLQTQVCHVDDILGLRIEVVATVVDNRVGDVTLTGVATPQQREALRLVDLVVVALVSLATSALSFSMPSPPLPITIPGLAV